MKKFDELTNDLTLVDFYTSWCGPCKMLAPVLEQLKNIDVIKVNVEEEIELGDKFKIYAVPTLILIKDKKEIARTEGYKDLEELEKWIEENK